MIRGKGVSTGIGFGTIVVLKNQERQIEKKTVEDSEKEMKRFKEALEQVTKETEEIVNTSSGTEKEIMSAYLMIMQDPTLTTETENAITNLNYSAEYAVEIGFNSVIQIFENMDDEYMAGRARDIADIKNRIIAKLFNEETVNISKLDPDTIIVATELTTSDTAKLDFENVVGIITELGGTNSHTSIMARTHAIPAITKVEEATKILRTGDYVAIDGEKGEIYLNPTKEEKEIIPKKEENNSDNKIPEETIIKDEDIAVSKDKITIIDESKDTACASAIEYYYEDNNYKYYFTCIKSGSIFVIVDGKKYNIKEALNNKVVTMAELESNGFKPLKEEKNLQKY